MTFQYIRRRPHRILYENNPFKVEWELVQGIYMSKQGWNTFFWQERPDRIYKITEIGYGRTSFTTSNIWWFRVTLIDGIPTELDYDISWNQIKTGAMRHKSTGQYVTDEELVIYKELL